MTLRVIGVECGAMGLTVSKSNIFEFLLRVLFFAKICRHILEHRDNHSIVKNSMFHVLVYIYSHFEFLYNNNNYIIQNLKI